MRDLLDKYLANGLADFEGLKISGSVPVKQELINDFLADFLRKAQQPAAPAPVAEAAEAPAAPPPAPAAKASANLPRELMRLVRRAEVKADDGKIVLEFEIAR